MQVYTLIWYAFLDSRCEYNIWCSSSWKHYSELYYSTIRIDHRIFNLAILFRVSAGNPFMLCIVYRFYGLCYQSGSWDWGSSTALLSASLLTQSTDFTFN